jgi:hypothetical protein
MGSSRRYVALRVYRARPLRRGGTKGRRPRRSTGSGCRRTGSGDGHRRVRRERCVPLRLVLLLSDRRLQLERAVHRKPAAGYAGVRSDRDSLRMRRNDRDERLRLSGRVCLWSYDRSRLMRGRRRPGAGRGHRGRKRWRKRSRRLARRGNRPRPVRRWRGLPVRIFVLLRHRELRSGRRVPREFDRAALRRGRDPLWMQRAECGHRLRLSAGLRFRSDDRYFERNAVRRGGWSRRGHVANLSSPSVCQWSSPSHGNAHGLSP